MLRSFGPTGSLPRPVDPIPCYISIPGVWQGAFLSSLRRPFYRSRTRSEPRLPPIRRFFLDAVDPFGGDYLRQTSEQFRLTDD